jgi:hypothetical protein
MLAKTLETIESSAPKQAAYTRALLAVLAIGVALKAIWFARLGFGQHRELVDFDAFHIIAQHVWMGDADLAYQFEKLIDMQKAASGGSESFMPWTYPPQFDLLLAPFGLIPIGIAYLLFVAGTLALYLSVLRSIATTYFPVLLIILFPAIEVTIACGQNGFLTAGLIGLICLTIEERPVVAGMALGLMVIKPHLAIAFGAYALLTRRWTVVMTAGAVVIGSSVVCTLVFGVKIWPALMQSVHDSAMFLQGGYYPLFRMISAYAGLRTLGVSASAAFFSQAVVAAIALGSIALALYRQLPARWTLGLTAMVSVSLSPYAYDYDFLIFGTGLAMLLPELRTIARESERTIIYTVPMIVGVYGCLIATHLGTSHENVQYLDVLSIGGFGVVAMIALIFMIMLRGVKPVTVRDLQISAERL